MKVLNPISYTKRKKKDDIITQWKTDKVRQEIETPTQFSESEMD